MHEIFKAPRVYVQDRLSEGHPLTLTDGVQHYLKNVLRVISGDAVRLFNGQDGEFVGRIETTGKKTISATIENKLRIQKNPPRKIHLLFAPIKKERMDWMVEKAVELGATDLHIILTQNTDIRKTNDERLRAQIIEAAEQCERMDIPVLHPGQDVFRAMAVWNKAVPLMAALERFDAKPLRDRTASLDADCALLIGPSGGFTEEEKQKLSALTFVQPVSLGDNVLRSETAAAAGLSLLTL